VLTSLARVRLQQQKYAEAGATAREALMGNEKARPDSWQRYQSQSLLGASLGGQKRYAEAEPLLLSGYEGMIQRESTMSAFDQFNLAEIGESIVKLYQSWGKPEEAAEWRQKLQVTSPPGAAKRP
jgi:eukaryotic-like serine/threonine-protein kinase